MPGESSPDVKFEIGHVLFIDIVGYSKLLITEQSAQLQTLKEIVRGTEQVRRAEAEGKLLRLPTGDGGALVFRTSPEAPVRCAMEIAKSLKSYPKLRVRMGIHSGPVNEISDLNEQANIAGAGINMAQRVMDCGDAGHILLSRHVAEDLEQYPRWQPQLHDLGECEVKHGVRVSVVNFYTDELGNPDMPERLKSASVAAAVAAAKRPPSRRKYLFIAGAAILVLIAIAGFLFWQRGKPKTFAITSAIPQKSIAVLPFENLSEDKANAFFADGVQDEILTDLAKIADLKVISRTSVIGYRDTAGRNLRKIGQELGVAHLLEGSVQRSGNRVRLNAQLIDARNDAHLWAQTYDRDLADIFTIQSEIAKAIADQLQAKLSPSERQAIERAPTSNLAAFDLYARAKALLRIANPGKAEWLQAIDLLDQAVARDPSFFDAYCQLATAHGQLYSLDFDRTPARFALAAAAAEAAGRLRPDAGETHLARARNLYYGPRDYQSALAELELAGRTLPNDPQLAELKGYIERRQGRWDESTRDLERAIELDPRNAAILGQVAISYHNLRRYTEQRSAYNRILSFTPNDPFVQAQLGFVDFEEKADSRPYHQVLDSIRHTNPAAIPAISADWLYCALAEHDAADATEALVASGENSVLQGWADNVRFSRPFVQGVIARMSNDPAKAETAFAGARAEQEKIPQAQPDDPGALCVLGLIDAALGRKDDALREGRRAVELLPMEKDAKHGIAMHKYLAMIAAWVGDKELACEQLTIAVSRPNDLGYGQLKLDPFWDPLRGDRCFEQIVASLAPNETK
jgi:serine/threonine-protein kinase